MHYLDLKSVRQCNKLHKIYQLCGREYTFTIVGHLSPYIHWFVRHNAALPLICRAQHPTAEHNTQQWTSEKVLSHSLGPCIVNDCAS